MPFKLIAGRGSQGEEFGETVTRDINILKAELRELKKHIGETVILTGGGGPGQSTGTLKSAKIEPIMGKGLGLKVYLENTEPPCPYSGTSFDPWIDSWKIHAEVKGDSSQS